MKLIKKIKGSLKIIEIIVVNRGKISIKKSSHISFSTRIRNNKGNFNIGESLHTKRNVDISGISGNLKIGNHVFINRNSIIAVRSNIKIGDNTSIGPNVCIYDHDHAFSKEGTIKGEYKYGDVIIGKGCWIGAGAIILRGTTIGDYSVIGAGCIVKGDIPNNSIVKSNRDLIIEDIK